jgi:hypothetical protein
MLASYFPPATTTTNPGDLGPAAASQVPDDFLSRVFSFSWDNNSQSHGRQVPGTGSQGATPVQTPSSANPATGGPGQAPGQPPAHMPPNGAPGPGQRQNSMSGYGAFDWSSHGWMA